MYDATIMIIVSVCVGMVVAAGSRPLECFWCGPLANQVHKSTRPPPCEGPGNHYMICEQQYTNCATVYSSPPHMESRVCTKTYSEECYTEFCNTTRTWKITCPCEGNMCNVRDVSREIKLFNILNHLVVKTFRNNRFKRSNILKYRSMKAHLNQAGAKQDHLWKRSIPSLSRIDAQFEEQDSEDTQAPIVMVTTTATTTASPTPTTAVNTWPLSVPCWLKSNIQLGIEREDDEWLKKIQHENAL